MLCYIISYYIFLYYIILYLLYYIILLLCYILYYIHIISHHIMLDDDKALYDNIVFDDIAKALGGPSPAQSWQATSKSLLKSLS